MIGQPINSTEWRQVDQFTMAHLVIRQWAEDAGDLGIGFDDLTTDVFWQAVSADTMAFKIGGDALLVVEWDYDVDQDGDGQRDTTTIHSWHLGTEAKQ